MNERLIAFNQKVREDKKIWDALEAMKILPMEEAKAHIVAIAKEVGVELTEEDVMELDVAAQESAGKKAETGEELSDEAMAKVAGGKIEWGSDGRRQREDEVTYEFYVGARVEVKWPFWRTFRGTVTDRYIKQYNEVCMIESFYIILKWYQPCYSVQYDDGDFEKDIKQNELSY